MAGNRAAAQPVSRESASGPTPIRVEALASKALSVLAARRVGRNPVFQSHLANLMTAILHTDPAARRNALDLMRDDGVLPEDICDRYIPEAARSLGSDWEADRVTFAAVTIGTARLQAILRDLSPPETVQKGPRRISVLVIAEEFHTLGALVLTGQLRRSGVSVRLVLGRSVDEMCNMAADARYDGILISVCVSEDLDSVRHLVHMLRDVTTAPLFVGGSILSQGADQVRRLTDADHVTDDLNVALELMGVDTTFALPG